MAQSKPIYIFVGGVSHTPAFFKDMIKQMAIRGYESTAVAFPTCGNDTDNTKQWDEVTAIQDAVSVCVDSKDRDVVLVLHSYGGWPGSRAVKGFDKETRQKNGKSTGIVEVAFLAAFLLPDNAPMAQYSYLPPWLTVEVRVYAPLVMILWLISCRMVVASQMVRQSPYFSVTWTPLLRSTGSQSSSGTVTTLLRRLFLTRLGTSQSQRRISSRQMTRPQQPRFSFKCCRVLLIRRGLSRVSNPAMSPS